jgi:hypothetical protein
METALDMRGCNAICGHGGIKARALHDGKPGNRCRLIYIKIILSFIFGVDICSPARFSGKFNRFTMNALVALK